MTEDIKGMTPPLTEGKMRGSGSGPKMEGPGNRPIPVPPPPKPPELRKVSHDVKLPDALISFFKKKDKEGVTKCAECIFCEKLWYFDPDAPNRFQCECRKNSKSTNGWPIVDYQHDWCGEGVRRDDAVS